MSKRRTIKHHSWQQDSLLIAEVQKRPCLYDKTDENFTNYSLRHEIWEEIGETVGVSDIEAKLRFRDIRDCFLKFLKRAQENANANKPIRMYRFANNLKFLIPHTTFATEGLLSSLSEGNAQPNNEFVVEGGWEVEGYESADDSSSTPNLDHSQVSIKRSRSETDRDELTSAVMMLDDDQQLAKSEHRGEEDAEVEDGPSTHIPSAATYTPPRPHTNVKRRRIQNFNGVPEVDHPVVRQSTPQDDELELFFKTICVTVRKLPPVLQSKLRFQIMEMVYKAELDHLTDE